MKYRLVVLFYFICNIILAQGYPDINWNEDIGFLKKELPKRHIDLFSKKSRKNFNSALDNVLNEVSKSDNLEMALKLQKVISTFGDSHTSISWSSFIDDNKLLPVLFHWLHDGIYIVQATNDHKDLLGRKVVGINNFPIQIIIDSLSTLITLDNIAIGKRDIPQLMSFVQLLHYFKFAKNDRIYLNLKNSNKDDEMRSNVLILPSKKPDRKDWIQLKPEANPISYMNRGKLFYSQYIPEEKIYYIQYNKCWSKELEEKYNNGKNADKYPSFTEFEEQVLTDLKTKTIDKLIFDFRYNSGGSSLQGTLFIENVFRSSVMRKAIPVYVIIGRYTYSSAIINVMDLKKYNNTILVGEETSGKPNHFGEVRKFKLPSSGLTVNYSTKYFQRTMENENSIKPDVEKLLSISDYVAGFDPSFEYIKLQ